jgi:5-methylcytosine-specific restriction endonuclease McrA
MKLLRSSLPMLRSPLALLPRHASEQTVERVNGNTMRSLKRRALRRQGYRCACELCTAHPHGGLRLTMDTCELDHHVPLYAGGTNAIENLRALSVPCHARVTREQHADRATRRGHRTG